MTVEHDNKAAVEFLLRWKPGGPWVLTAIRPDRKHIATQTFDPHSIADLGTWLGEYNGNRNIYFHVNPTFKPMGKKAEREDIASLSWLHVDIDPRAGEDLGEEQARALELVTTKLPTGVPKPTCVIFSGGGYQAFWRLEEPLELTGKLPEAEDAKLYNLQLEILFGGDNCHNVDRIMRLPGTINIPDDRKRKKGRVEALAHVVEFTNALYTLASFSKAPEIQSTNDASFGDSGGGSGIHVNVGGNVTRTNDMLDLEEYEVPPNIQRIIGTGTDEFSDVSKRKDNTKSSWLFQAVCGLVRCEVPDEIIYGIITDKDWPIAESVLAASNADRYAKRQIERAKEVAIDPKLEWLNRNFAVIENIGGACRIIEEVEDDFSDGDNSFKRTRLTVQSFADFKNRYMNKPIQIGVDADGVPKYKPMGEWWLSNPHRRQFRTITFAPGRDVVNAYNLWQGFACPSIPGDCNLYLDHLRDNVCLGNQEHFDYLMGWMARMIQQPAQAGEVAVVLRGGKGTGKSFFAVELGKLLGRHFLHVSNGSHLTGNFNAHLRDLVLLFADEAFYANDRKHESILKTLITENTLTIERKGVDVETAPNFIHLIMASNDRHVVPAGPGERRFFVLDVGREHQQDSQYFSAISKQMDSGGREALLHMLLHYDLEGFDVRSVPATEALAEQKRLTMASEQEWWYQKLMKGCILKRTDGWPNQISKAALVDDYVSHMKDFQIPRRATETMLGIFYKSIWPGTTIKSTLPMIASEYTDEFGHVRLSDKVRVPHFRLPTLDDFRTKWDEEMFPGEWPDHEADDAPPF